MRTLELVTVGGVDVIGGAEKPCSLYLDGIGFWRESHYRVGRHRGGLEEKGPFMATRKTGAKAAKAASKVLRDGRTSKASKTAAGSALSQRAPKRKGK